MYLFKVVKSNSGILFTNNFLFNVTSAPRQADLAGDGTYHEPSPPQADEQAELAG